jgi:hypothetical protein
MTDISEQLTAMIDGFVRTQLVASAVRLRLPEYLAGRTVPAARLSALTGIGLHELRRYLRALEGLGLVELDGPDAYRGTELMGPLSRDTGGLYGHALLAGGEYYEAWSELDYALRTGNSAFERRHGHSLWQLLGQADETASWFARTMRFNTERFLDEILGLYKFPDDGVIADIGAGDGVLLAELLKRSPKLRGVAFEQPASIAIARRTMADYSVADRCEFVAGDFLTEVGVKADLHIIKSVIHNWDDESALRILRNCRAAVGERGRLLLIERATPAEDVLAEAILDLSMLVLFGGRSRSVKEYAALLQQAGFSAGRTITRSSGFVLLETWAHHTPTDGPS